MMSVFSPRIRFLLNQLLTPFLFLLLIFKLIGDSIVFVVDTIPFLFPLLIKYLWRTIRSIHAHLTKQLSTHKHVKYFSKKIQQRKNVLGGTVQSFMDLVHTVIKKKRTLRISFTSSWKSMAFVKRSLDLLRRFSGTWVKFKYFLLGSIITSSLLLGVYIHLLIKSLPNPSRLSGRDIVATTKLYDRYGKLLYEVYADQNRTPIDLSTVPLYIKDATIAIEDKNFYAHDGFSPRGIFRAILHNTTLDTQEGGSTITQQLVRSAFLTPEKTLTRKIKELFLSVWTEQLYTKDQILEMYLNQVPYGGTAWGIEAAAQTYFGKHITNVTLAEAALLAGLPAAPTRFSPFGSRPELAKQRQEEVLYQMVQTGSITQQDAQTAKQEELHYKTPHIALSAPHFSMYVRELLEEQYGSRMLEMGGLRVTTTLDLDLQDISQTIISSQLETLQRLSVGNGAALVTNPTSGEILAMVGSWDYFDVAHEGNVNVVRSLRQPGSSIKVVTYAAALQNGFTAASILDDSPITYPIAGQPSYTPVNYDGRYHGRIPLRIALASSYNIPAVKVLSRIGLDRMIHQGKMMGITSWNDSSRFGLSLTLGAGEVTMMDMAEVYGTLATGGIHTTLTPFIRITNYKGETVPLPYRKQPTRALSEDISYILTSILSDNQARSPAFGTNSLLVIPKKTVAVKTGTSDNKRDNWTIGYTTNRVVTTWVGNNNNTPMHPSLTSGVTGAAPIWKEIVLELIRDKDDTPFPVPEGIVSLPCNGRTEYFVRGTEPIGGCIPIVTYTPMPSP